MSDVSSRGYQAVWCTTGSKGAPVPQAGTTGGAPFPVPTAPDAAHTRPALRPPPTVHLLDVDDHDGDGTGPATIRAMEAVLGPLPPTWKLTAHGPDVDHGRFFYGIPDDLIINNKPFLAYGGSVDTVRTGWRFSMAPGDVHPRTGTPVVCYNADGQPDDELPLPDEVPSYPDKWLEYFRNFPELAAEKCAAVEAGELPDPLPAAVEIEISRPEAERPPNAENSGPSLHTAVMALVHACFDTGLSQEETTAVAILKSPYAAALADQRGSAAEHEVARAWGRAEAEAPDEAAWLTEGRKPDKLEQVLSCPRDLAVGLRRGLISVRAKKAADKVHRQQAAAETGRVEDTAGPGQQQQPGADPLAGLTPPAAPPVGELLPAPTAPMAVARIIEREYLHSVGVPTLRFWQGDWARWTGNSWRMIEDKLMDQLLYRRVETARYIKTAADGSQTIAAWAPTTHKIADLANALGAILLLPQDVTAPSWIDGIPRGVYIPVANGLLDAVTRTVYLHTPAFFSLGCAPFAYDKDAPEPAEWLKFLEQLWPDDPDAIGALQEWFGYILSGKTDQQKMMLIIGPPRSGKGTIALVLQALIGVENYASPLLSSLVGQFGLENLRDKTLAVISDVRLGSKTDKDTLAERLLTISGGDAVDVNRKFKTPVTVHLPLRFMMLSNQLPSFADTSGALATRFIVLTLTQSWLGKEDKTLFASKLAPELPGILKWALDGLDRLTANGSLTEPASSRDAVIALADAVSPLSAFVRRKCTVGPALEVDVKRLYDAYRTWCIHEQGRNYIETDAIFGKDLRSVVPAVKLSQPWVTVTDGYGTRRFRARIYQGIALKTGPDNDDDEDSATSAPSHEGALPEDSATSVESDKTGAGTGWHASQHITACGNFAQNQVVTQGLDACSNIESHNGATPVPARASDGGGVMPDGWPPLPPLPDSATQSYGYPASPGDAQLRHLACDACPKMGLARCLPACREKHPKQPSLLKPEHIAMLRDLGCPVDDDDDKEKRHGG